MSRVRGAAPGSVQRRRPARPPPPDAEPPKAAGWRARGGATKKPELLSSLRGTLVSPPRKDGARVPGVKAIAGVPVQRARAVHFTGLAGGGGPSTAGVNVSFGTLSRGQFDALTREFGGASKVRYDAQRAYDVVDFLPPALQALVNKDVDVGAAVTLEGSSRLRRRGGDYHIDLSPNCHGTAYEAMRAYQGASPSSVSLFFGEGVVADGLFRDEKRFLTVGRAEPGEAPAFLARLAPGDVVVFHRSMEGVGDLDLLHSAVYVGGGLFFEKPNTERDAHDETPYRLATFAQVRTPVADFHGEEPLSVVARRPQAPLEAGATAFAFSDAARLQAWASKKGVVLNRPLVECLDRGLGGATLAVHASAVDTHVLRIGADGRGVLE